MMLVSKYMSIFTVYHMLGKMLLICHEMMTCAAQLERSGFVTRERFFISGLLDVQGSQHDVAEVVATLPQMKGLRGFVRGIA